jgi:uncharacterized membrane protein
VIARLCAAIVGAVVLFAGASKITAWSQWRADARQQSVWPLVAIVLPPVELLLGAALVVLHPHPIVLGLTTLMLVIFTAFLAVQVMTKSVVPCACFGSRNSRPPTTRDVLRNIGLVLMMFVAAALS